MDISCNAIKNADGTIKAVIVFGLVRPVVQKNYPMFDEYCTLSDQYGNRYTLHADYDPALKKTDAVVVLKGE